jgi:uncharacterized membrane protein required for colicin V production
MGLDLTMGAVILIAALRGWIKGFVNQAVRIGGFIACVYLADPVRDQARPYVLARLPKIDPALLDAILWWVSAVASYIVLVGLITLAIQMMRTPPPPGMARSSRNDQFAGFLLGAAKGLLVAAFLTAGLQALQAYATELVPNATWVQQQITQLVRNATWVQQQMNESRALKWTDQYQPVPKILATPAVRNFVNQIQRNGLKQPSPSEGDEPRQVAEAQSEPEAKAEAETETTNDEIAKAVEELKAQLQLRGPNAD